MTGVRILIMVLLVCGTVGAQNGVSVKKTDHNSEEYHALCNLLKIAVQKWEEFLPKGSEDPLKKALGKTLFGKESGGDLEGLQSETFQQVYKEVEKNALSRLLWCGDPFVDGGLLGESQPRWPGHSAPHDLVCLCTVGPDGWPLNNNGKGKLCGLEGNALVATEKQGWGAGVSNSRGAKQIEATWESITKTCLEGNASGNNLKDALGDFLRKLKKTPGKKYPERYQLGEGESDEYPCGGGGTVCVMYYNGTSVTQQQNAKPWWTYLEDAIKIQDETKQEEKKREEKKTKKDVQKHQKSPEKESPQPPQAPSAAALKSTIPDRGEDEQINQENISAPLATIGETSSTPITHTMCLISAAFQI